jgi:hypothetical protein
MSMPPEQTPGLGLNLPVDDRQQSMLPTSTGPWPPPLYDPVAYEHKQWNAWWVGDRQMLAYVYYNLGENSPYGRAFFATTGEKGMPTPRPGQYRGGLLGSVEWSFWLREASPPRQGRSAPGCMSRSLLTSPRPPRACCSRIPQS